MKENKIIWTGEKFFGKKLYIESFGDKEIDKAFKSVFHDHYHRSAPLRIAREDVQTLISYQGAKSRPDGSGV